MDFDTIKPTPIFSFIDEVNNIWSQIFLDECAKLAKSEPWLDDEELEAKAEERTNKYIYLWHKDRLQQYQRIHTWRGEIRE